MNVRAATAQDAAGIVGLHKASNPHGDWYRDPLARLGRVPYEDLTPFERYLHGGFGMDLSLFRRHFHELLRRGFPVIVAEGRGKILGECEVWLDDEPPPFGRYAAVTTLESGSPPDRDVERELLARAEDKARKLGYATLDLCARSPGGEPAAEALGFAPLWDTRTFQTDLADVPAPEEEFATKFLAAEYGDLGGLLRLDHREPARWRFETLVGVWPAAQVAGLADATKLVAVTVRPDQGAGFAVLAARRAWRDPPVGEIDIWLAPPAVRRRSDVGRAFRIAAEIARKLGVQRAETNAPPSASSALQGLGFAMGDTPSVWRRRSF